MQLKSGIANNYMIYQMILHIVIRVNYSKNTDKESLHIGVIEQS